MSGFADPCVTPPVVITNVTVYVQADAPNSANLNTNDMWFDTTTALWAVWDGTEWDYQTLGGAEGETTVSVQGGDYTLQSTDNVVVFTATATATLPSATGSGRTYRIVCRAGALTIDPDGVDTVKGETTALLNAGEDLILTDTAAGVWE